MLGTLLSLHSNRGRAYAGYSIRVDGSSLTELTDASVGNVSDVSFEPDGDRILFYTLEGGLFLASPPWPITLSAAVSLADVKLPEDKGDEWRTTQSAWSWSPDGRLISGRLTAVSRTGIGVYEPVSDEWRLVPAEGVDSAVRWLSDSRRVVYFTQEGELVVLDVETAERRVVPVDLPLPRGDNNFAIAPDGKAIYYSGERIESNIWMMERAR